MEKSNKDYLIEDLVFNVCQLNCHLSSELKKLQDEKGSSRITNDIRELATATAIMTNVLATKISNIDTFINDFNTNEFNHDHGDFLKKYGLNNFCNSNTIRD